MPCMRMTVSPPDQHTGEKEETPPHDPVSPPTKHSMFSRKGMINMLENFTGYFLTLIPMNVLGALEYEINFLSA